MNMDKKKKAAIAAVMQYLETERRQMAAMGGPARVVAIPDAARIGVARPYGLAGRSTQMQIRTIMHYRGLRG